MELELVNRILRLLESLRWNLHKQKNTVLGYTGSYTKISNSISGTTLLLHYHMLKCQWICFCSAMIISPIEDPFPNLTTHWNSDSFNWQSQKNPNERLDPAWWFLSSKGAVGWIVFFTLPLCSLSLGLHHHITSLGLRDAISGNTILQKAMAWKLWFIHFIGAEVLVNLGRWRGGTVSARWHDRCQQPGKYASEVQDMKS